MSPHETYYAPPSATVAAPLPLRNTFSNEVNCAIDPRQLQPLEHPCTNSYDAHALSICNNPCVRAKSPERILLEAADHTSEAAIKAALSEHGRQWKKAHTCKILVGRVHQQTPITIAAAEETATGTLVIRIEDAVSSPPPPPSTARKQTGKKLALTCHFCQACKIACGLSRSGEGDETCK
jgi:hypothetical protein